MEGDEYGDIQMTPLQEQIAGVIAAIIRETLPTAHDKKIVLAVLIAAAQTEEEEWDRWKDLIDSVAFGGSIALDMFGDLPPRAPLQSRLGNKYEPWNEDC